MRSKLASPPGLRVRLRGATVTHQENAMLGRDDKGKVDLECPKCGTKFQVTEAQAAKGKVTCPKGHEFGVMGLMGSGGPM
jgi:predicted Zn finger-like uncharacterized protein